jgi:methylglutaconyl-CoA hydratase
VKNGSPKGPKGKAGQEPALVASFEGGVLRLRLNRPRVHNALDGDLLELLAREAASVPRRDPPVRIVLLEGAGDSFCAGADVEWMRRQGEASEAENLRSALELGALYEEIDRLEVPLVARVQGAVRGGGVGLVAVADVVVAAAGATFALPEVRLGLVPAVITPFVLEKIGASRAREVMLTGRRLDSAEAQAAGLVHHVAADAELDAALEKVISRLLAGGPEAQRRVKRLLRGVAERRGGDRAELLRFTAGETAAARAGREGREGTAAFLEKRAPGWARGGDELRAQVPRE